MAGRGDKGRLVTADTFTTDAKSEATRDGAPPLDLIDGARLCELLKTYELGVKITTRRVDDVEILPGFFNNLCLTRPNLAGCDPVHHAPPSRPPWPSAGAGPGLQRCTYVVDSPCPTTRA